MEGVFDDEKYSRKKSCIFNLIKQMYNLTLITMGVAVDVKA